MISAVADDPCFRINSTLIDQGSTVPVTEGENAVIPDLDIYRSAQVLVKQHGGDSPGA